MITQSTHHFTYIYHVFAYVLAYHFRFTVVSPFQLSMIVLAVWHTLNASHRFPSDYIQHCRKTTPFRLNLCRVHGVRTGL